MRQLRAADIPFVAVNLEPVFGSIESYTESIERGVRALEAATGRAPLIVAHSMGGLAVRSWIAHGQEHRFHRIVTIATPHRGTRIARHGFTANMRQMQVGGPWLAALAARENPTLYTRFTCFWGHCDNVVFPTTNATLPGADNRHLRATPHVQMAYHPAVLGEVLRLLEEPEPCVSRSSSAAPRSAPGAASPPATG
jgi:triacylglycerol esterase/lipase EstA (alpha/beta hydrolase family)